MTVSRSFNNKNFAIPVNGDRNWGKAASDFLIEVASAALSKAGGNFTLSADVNFGADFGLIAKYLKSASSNIAQSGIIRLANNEGLGFRNAASDADLILKVNGSDQLEYNGSPIAVDADVSALEGRMDSAETNISANATNIGVLASNVAQKLQANQGIASQLRIDDFLDFDEEADPATPAAGKVRLWADASKEIWKKDSAGVKSKLGGGGLKPVTIKTSSGTVASLTSEPVNPSGGAIERVLPVSALDDAVEIYDVSGVSSATNYIAIKPGGTDKILYKGVASSDRLVMRRPYCKVGLKKEAGSDTWKVELQTTSIPGRANAGSDGAVAPRKGHQDLIITATGWTTQRAKGIFYLDQDGNPRLKFNVYGSTTNVAKTGLNLAMGGVAIGPRYQALASYVETASGWIPSGAYANEGGGQFYVRHAEQPTNFYLISGDVELVSKPSWAV